MTIFPNHRRQRFESIELLAAFNREPEKVRRIDKTIQWHVRLPV